MSEKLICAVDKCGAQGYWHDGALFALCAHHFCLDEERRELKLSIIEEAEKTERDMLRTFYENWVTMHAIKYDDLHKRQKQEAAQILWDQAQRLKNFYLPTTEMRLVQPVPAR